MRTYRRTTKLPPCRLGPDDLRGLAGIITAGLDPTEINNVQVSTDLKHFNVSERGIEPFLSNIDLPPTLTNVSLMLVGVTGKFIAVHFSNKDAEAYYVTDNTDWLEGRDAEICRFIRNRRQRSWFIRTRQFLAIYLIVPVLSLSFGQYLRSSKITSSPLNTLSQAITMLDYALIAALFFVVIFSPYCKIVLSSKKTWDIKKEFTLSDIIVIILTIVLVVLAITGPLRK